MSTEQSPSTSLDEIVVTAQKRSERLQDVPVSVNVVSSQALASNHITSVDQIQEIAPSVSFTNSGNTRGQGLAIRGIGTLNFSDGVEPSVSTIVDGVVIGRSAAGFFDFNDVSRIEVLRGPQGTLFGKNSSAGVINIVTERPDLNYAFFKGSASYASFNQVQVHAAASTPLVQDKLALDVSAYRNKSDGLVTNLYNGDNLNGDNSYGVRAKLLYHPLDTLELYLIGDYARSDLDCCVSTIRSILPATHYWGATGPTRAQLLSGIDIGPYSRQDDFDGPQFNNQSSYGGSLEMNAQLADLTLTSISAYRKFHVNDNNDTDLVPIDIVNINSADQSQHQFTQELRLTSPATDRVSYVLGFFYFNQTVATVTHLRGTGNLVLPPGAYAANDINRSITSKSVSGFGQAQLRLTDRLRLIGGLRYTTDDYNAWFYRTVPAGAVGAFPILGGPAFSAPSLAADDNNVSYRVGLQYDITPDIMAYATYTTGYKGSALNMLNNLSQVLVSSGAYKLRPEKASNAEVGVRSAFFDRKLTLNVTGYYEQVREFQAQTFDNVLNTFALANAGKLRADGVEAEAVFAPLRQLSFSANLAYTQTRIDGLVIGCYPGQTAAQGCLSGRQDVSGDMLANSPKWAYSLSGNYTKPLGSLPVELFANATYSYRSSVFFSYGDPNTVQPGYGIVNAALGVERPDRRLRLSVFARNLFDRHYATLIGTGFLDTSATGAGYTQLLTNDAWRTVGVEVSTEF